MSIAADHVSALTRARRSLEGLSVGDAFGETFFARRTAIAARTIAEHAPWRWTDDTAMAFELVEELAARGDVDVDSLAGRFARRYAAEPWRGYGGTAHEILGAINDGVPHRVAASAPFGGQGSKGNGSAMRIAPLGAYFAHDLDAAIAAAVRSAHPTHRHREAEAGAIAVAVAAALVAGMDGPATADAGPSLLAAVYERTPPSLTRHGIDLAAGLAPTISVNDAALRLGNGSRVLCDDTVPFCLWAVARHLGDYTAALWTTVSALGDMDTTCAIVGGILAAGPVTIPPDWLARREALPPSAA